jgi:SAM-dependent methyltransferase
MATAPEHYERLLGPIYAWSLGDPASVDAAAAQELDTLGVRPTAPGSLAVDLGCGHGVYLRQLASRGFRVLGLDSDATLLQEAKSPDQPAIEVRRADLRSPSGLTFGAADWVFCLGDTLTHLETHEQVSELVSAVAARLQPGGIFVSTFRDYTARTLVGESRFIPVRFAEDRLMTCFVEDAGDHVRVHDIVHAYGQSGWSLQVGAYEKLKLAPAQLIAACATSGLSAEISAAPRGMVRCVARKC